MLFWSCLFLLWCCIRTSYDSLFHDRCNLKAIAVEDEVFAAWFITENEDSSVIMMTNIITHSITFLFIFHGRTGIGFVGSTGRCPSSPPAH